MNASQDQRNDRNENSKSKQWLYENKMHTTHKKAHITCVCVCVCNKQRALRYHDKKPRHTAMRKCGVHFIFYAQFWMWFLIALCNINMSELKNLRFNFFFFSHLIGQCWPILVDYFYTWLADSVTIRIIICIAKGKQIKKNRQQQFAHTMQSMATMKMPSQIM